MPRDNGVHPEMEEKEHAEHMDRKDHTESTESTMMAKQVKTYGSMIANPGPAYVFLSFLFLPFVPSLQLIT